MKTINLFKWMTALKKPFIDWLHLKTCLQAKVVCRQLGFSRALSFSIKSKFGNVHSDFSYDEIQCQGNEDTPDSCPHSNSEDCTHEEGAGVVCSD